MLTGRDGKVNGPFVRVEAHAMGDSARGPGCNAAGASSVRMVCCLCDLFRFRGRDRAIVSGGLFGER